MPRPTVAPLRILPPPRLLAAGRVLAGLSQRELAAAAGLAASSLGRYEMGASMLRADSMDAMLAVLAEHGVRFVQAVDEGVGVMLAGEPKPKIPGRRARRAGAPDPATAGDDAAPSAREAGERPVAAVAPAPEAGEGAQEVASSGAEPRPRRGRERV